MHWNWAMARRFSDFYKQGVFFQHFCRLLLFPVLFRLVDALYTTGFRRINECCHCDSTFGACRILRSRKVFWKPGILQSTAILLVCNPFAIQNGMHVAIHLQSKMDCNQNSVKTKVRNLQSTKSCLPKPKSEICNPPKSVVQNESPQICNPKWIEKFTRSTETPLLFVRCGCYIVGKCTAKLTTRRVEWM